MEGCAHGASLDVFDEPLRRDGGVADPASGECLVPLVADFDIELGLQVKGVQVAARSYVDQRGIRAFCRRETRQWSPAAGQRTLVEGRTVSLRGRSRVWGA